MKEKDVNYMINKKLVQVRLNLYTLDLVLEDDIIISSGYKVKYIKRGVTIFEWKSSEKSLFSINNLLDISIEKAYFDEASNLIIEFLNQEFLLIAAEHSSGESYIIFNNNDLKIFS